MARRLLGMTQFQGQRKRNSHPLAGIKVVILRFRCSNNKHRPRTRNTYSKTYVAWKEKNPGPPETEDWGKRDEVPQSGALCGPFIDFDNEYELDFKYKISRCLRKRIKYYGFFKKC